MMLSLIVAMTRARVIGINNTLPWRLPGDLKRFKQITMGHPIVMGRKTFDSIGKALPGRRNVVITRQADLVIPGADVVHSLTEALLLLHDVPEVFIIGGAQIFEEALPLADKLYVTWIEEDIKGDAFFPDFDLARFKIIESSGPITEPLPHEYVDYLKP